MKNLSADAMAALTRDDLSKMLTVQSISGIAGNDNNNMLLAKVLAHPDCTNGLIDLLNSWSKRMNNISDIADAQMQTIINEATQPKSVH